MRIAAIDGRGGLKTKDRFAALTHTKKPACEGRRCAALDFGKAGVIILIAERFAAQISREARTDSLTGLAVRRVFVRSKRRWSPGAATAGPSR